MKTAHAPIPKFTVINENHDHTAHARACRERYQGEQTAAALGAHLSLRPTKRAVTNVCLKTLIVSI